jgi:hypothetical protein
VRDEKLIALKKLIVGLAAYYGHPLDEFVVGMYAEDLVDLPIGDIARAVREIRLDPANTRFPLPAVIRAKASASTNDTDIARDVAARIYKAIGRHGHNWSEKDKNWPSEPIAELGEAGWEVVKRLGGWYRMCEFSGEVSAGIFLAQVRDLTESTLRMARAGHLHQAPTLPAPSKGANSSLERFSPKAFLTHVQASEPKEREEDDSN